MFASVTTFFKNFLTCVPDKKEIQGKVKSEYHVERVNNLWNSVAVSWSVRLSAVSAATKLPALTPPIISIGIPFSRSA